MNSDSDDGLGECVSLYRDRTSKLFDRKPRLKSEQADEAVYMLKVCPKRKKKNSELIMRPSA
jgi:hypothetical protein